MITPEQLKPSPGIYDGIPFDLYRRWHGWSPSRVKSARESLRRLRWELDTCFHRESDDLDFGAVAHMALLEPDQIPMRCALWKGGRRYGKEWDAFEATHKDQIILREQDYVSVLGIRDSLQRHPLVKQLIPTITRREVSLVWDNPATGMRCKGRPDAIADRIVDLKTTKSLKWFERDVFELGYHIQAGAYVEGWYELAHEILDVVFVVVSKEPPFDVMVRPLSTQASDRGGEIWNELLRSIQQCEQQQRWPGPADDEEVPVELPEWETKDVELSLEGKRIEL